MKRWLFLTLLLCSWAFPCRGQINGAYNVTETWSVTIEYDGFANNVNTTRHYSGTASGTVNISYGSYKLIDKIGIAWGGSQKERLLSRSISEFNGNYSISGDYPFVPAYTSSAHGLVFLGFFAVRVPFLDGEIPAFYRTRDYSAYGRADNINGSGSMQGVSVTVSVSSTLRIARKPPESIPPVIRFNSPASNAHFTSPTITIEGAASDNVAVGSVEYRVENSAGAGFYALASGTNSWSKAISLQPGLNTIRVRARDIYGTYSKEVTRIFYYDLASPFTLAIVGKGTVSPPLNSSNLIIGRAYTLTAKSLSGHTFQGWTGDATGKSAVLKFTMKNNMRVQANFADRTKPSLTILSPKNNQRLSNEVVKIQGTAKDNDTVAAVWFQQNGGLWKRAEGSNTWTASATLPAGSNQFRFYSQDQAGNRSPTNLLDLTYVKTQPLDIVISGGGKVQPNLSGKLLEVGKTYTFTAIRNPSYRFDRWQGTAVGTNPVLRLIAPDQPIQLTAFFVDIGRPTLLVTSPKPNQQFASSRVVISGTAQDNAAVRRVLYSIDGVAFQGANGSNQWTATLDLQPGNHNLRIVSEDTTGNRSKTNLINFAVKHTAPQLAGDPIKLKDEIKNSEPLPPKLEATRNASGHIAFTFNTEEGRSYRIQYSNDLQDWQDLLPPFTADTDQYEITDQPTESHRFYRIVVQ